MKRIPDQQFEHLIIIKQVTRSQLKMLGDSSSSFDLNLINKFMCLEELDI